MENNRLSSVLEVHFNWKVFILRDIVKSKKVLKCKCNVKIFLNVDNTKKNIIKPKFYFQFESSVDDIAV